MSIERVGVIGAGQMGSGIAEVSAKAGADVLVYEPTEELTTAGSNAHHRVAGARGEPRASSPTAIVTRALARLTFTTEPRRPVGPPARHRGGRRGRGREGEGLRRTRPCSSTIPTRCWRRTRRASRS